MSDRAPADTARSSHHRGPGDSPAPAPQGTPPAPPIPAVALPTTEPADPTPDRATAALPRPNLPNPTPAPPTTPRHQPTTNLPGPGPDRAFCGTPAHFPGRPDGASSDRLPGGPARSSGPPARTAPAPSPGRPVHSSHAWSAVGPVQVVEDWARSGVPLLTGHAAGAPLLPPGGAAGFASWLADRVAAAGGARLDGGRLLAERAALGGRGRRGRLSVGGSCRLLPTRDGWAAVSDARPDDPLLWSALIGREFDAEALPGRLAEWLTAHDGADLDERVELLGLAGGAVRPRPGRSCPLPGPPREVRGLLVVDFSALWAGPLCAHLLGSAGAEVVKVETPSRPDGARFGDPAFYDLLHAGHRSVVLDPTDTRGRAALRKLVGRADVVIEASRPRALAGFGLDAAAEAARGCTWISITAPQPRRPVAAAPASGADTATVLRRLGIEAP